MTFVLTLGGAERFAHSRDVAGFLGLRPKQGQSGARDPQLGFARAAILIWASCWCAHHILGHWGKDSALLQWGLAKTEGGKKATLRALVMTGKMVMECIHQVQM